MTNKEIEKFVRDHYCLRNCDQVNVEFLYSDNMEHYSVTDYVVQNGKDMIRVTDVIVESGKNKHPKIEIVKTFGIDG